MTISAVWSIARPDARRSSAAPATTAGVVAIGSSRSRMTATASLSIATAPRGADDGMKEHLLDSYFKIDKVIDGLVYG